MLDCNVSKADNSLNSEELVNDIVNNGIHTINHSILTNYSVENRAHLESVNENANNYVSVSDSNSGSISTLRDCNPRSPDISVIDDLNTVINLKIMVWNIHGLGDKLKDADFLQCISKYDLVIFLETMKLDTYSPDTGKFVYKHFQRHYQHPRARKPAGGIAVLIKSCYENDCTVKIVKNSDFTVWIQIKQNNHKLFLAAVYIPPLDSCSTISSFQNNNAFNLIQEEITHFNKKGNIAICGNFNARPGQLSDYSITPGNDAINLVSFDSDNKLPMYDRHSDDIKSNKYGRELIELCKSSNICGL